MIKHKKMIEVEKDYEKIFMVNGKKMNSEEYNQFLIECIIYAKKKIISLENQNSHLKNILMQTHSENI